MIGKSQSKLAPTIAGVMSQTGTYGSTIPRIIGTTMTSPLLTWLNGIRKAASSKKGTKKAGVNTYNACCSLLIGHNPIQHALRVIASNVGLGLNNSKITTGYGVTSFTITDPRFYALIGITVTTSFSTSFDDYGSSGTQTLSGNYELPLWNLAMQGPDPTNSSGYRNSPWTYFNQSGSTVISQLPTLSGPSTLNIYYASTVVNGFGAGEFPLPFVLNCDFEPSLGDGPEYSGYKDFTAQQIIYPMFAGAGSSNFDIGMGSPPQMRIEVMGAYTLYPDPVASSVEPRADADFADMVEDIFKMGQTQAALTDSGIGVATASSPIQAGVSCWEYPGTVQKKFWAQNVNGNFSGHMQIDLPVTQGNILVAAVASNGSSVPSISDGLSNTWISVVGASGVGFWYAKASSSGFTGLNFANVPSNADVQFFEIAGCDTFDAAVLSSASGSSFPSGSITTSSNIGQQGYVLAWVFSGFGAATGTGVVPFWNPLIPSSSQGGNNYGFGTQWSFSEYRLTNAPGLITFTGDQATSNWIVVMFAVKNLVAPSFPKPFGNILDEDSLNQCRIQCRANGLWGSLNMNSQQAASKWLEDLYICMNAWPVWSGFKLKSVPLSEVSTAGNGAVYTSATTAGPIVSLSDSAGDFIGNPSSPLIDIERKAVVERPSLLRLQHINASDNYNQTALSQPDVMGLTLYGLRYASPKVLNMLQHIAVSRKILSIMVRRQNYLLNTYKFKLVAKYKLLEAGDLVTISDQQLGLSNVPVRFTSITESNTYDLDCEAEDFLYGLHDPKPLPTTESQSSGGPGTTDVPLPINTPIFFEPPLALTGDTQDQLWITVSDPDPVYGGSQVYVSVDGGISYNPLEGTDGTSLVQGNAVTGVTTSNWPQALDPDSTNNLTVNLTESLGVLDQYSTTQENNFTFPCYVSGGGGVFPFELMTYGSALLTSAFNYNLQATGGGGGVGIEDIMDWVMIGSPLRTTHHLSGSGVYAANWLDADGLKFWLIKNTAGNPWDINTYDTSFIYHYITENADTSEPGGSHWGVASAFKRHEPPLVPIMPRFYNPSGGPVTITTPGPNPFVRTIACETDGEPLINLGPTTNVTSGPTNMSWGGDVGTQATLVNTYYYGNQREQFFYCKGLGLIQWQHANLTSGSPITGTYAVDQTTLHNMIIAGGCPTPNFPCYTSIPGAGFSGSWIGGVPGAGGNIAVPSGSSGGGGNFLRRAAFGTWASTVLPNTGAAHASSSRFAFVGTGAEGIFKVRVPSVWTGQNLHFKFVQFNSFGSGVGSLAASTDYTYTPLGIANTGGSGGGTGGSGGGGNTSYTINPTQPLTNPTSTTIVMAAVTATFSPSNLQTHYNTRTFTISAPSVPTTYYVTVYDPGLTGDTGASTNLTAFCTTSLASSNVGSAGYIYMGSIVALPTGGGTGSGGGSNPGTTPGSNSFAISSAVVGTPSSSQLVAIYTAFSTESFPANFGSPNQSYGTVGTNPTATATYTVNKNGSSIGTISISTGGVFTFSTSGGLSFSLVANDRVTIVAPSSVDTTMADVSITLVGTR